MSVGTSARAGGGSAPQCTGVLLPVGALGRILGSLQLRAAILLNSSAPRGGRKERRGGRGERRGVEGERRGSAGYCHRAGHARGRVGLQRVGRRESYQGASGAGLELEVRVHSETVTPAGPRRLLGGRPPERRLGRASAAARPCQRRPPFRRPPCQGRPCRRPRAPCRQLAPCRRRRPRLPACPGPGRRGLRRRVAAARPRSWARSPSTPRGASGFRARPRWAYAVAWNGQPPLPSHAASARAARLLHAELAGRPAGSAGGPEAASAPTSRSSRGRSADASAAAACTRLAASAAADGSAERRGRRGGRRRRAGAGGGAGGGGDVKCAGNAREERRRAGAVLGHGRQRQRARRGGQ